MDQEGIRWNFYPLSVMGMYCNRCHKGHKRHALSIVLPKPAFHQRPQHLYVCDMLALLYIHPLWGSRWIRSDIHPPEINNWRSQNLKMFALESQTPGRFSFPVVRRRIKEFSEGILSSRVLWQRRPQDREHRRDPTLHQQRKKALNQGKCPQWISLSLRQLSTREDRRLRRGLLLFIKVYMYVCM